MSITGTFNGVSIVTFPNIQPQYEATVPGWMGLSSVEFSMNDAVASVLSPFTGQTQIQSWPGADSITGTIEFPPLEQWQADIVLSFLAECRGMQNGFLLGDPMKRFPSGRVSGVPVVSNTTGSNAPMGQTLYTRGWTANQFGLLLPGDYLQLGMRLHRVLDRVNSDSSGGAAISIWPSIREQPTDGEPLIFSNPQGFFRLATNKRTWSSDVKLLTNVSVQVIECR